MVKNEIQEIWYDKGNIFDWNEVIVEHTLSLKTKTVKKFRQGYPLITKDVVNHMSESIEEGNVLKLVDEQNRFIGKGYYGIQNKGIGWVLTNDAGEEFDTAFFKRKLQKAIKERKPLYDNPDTTAFRVFNAEGDGIGGVTIDFYGGYYLIQWYSKGIYEFRSYLLTAMDELVEYKGIYQKKRFDKAGQYVEEDDFVKGERGDFPLLIKENGIRYAVDLNEGAMTGIFLDQRNVRKTIRDKYANGKTVLNTFSYTGAFSVAAALGGAVKTTSVDVANRSLPKTKEQFLANGIDPDTQEIKVMDVFDYFGYAVKKSLAYDLVILDPPSFARTKKRTFSSQKDYKQLIKDAVSITAKKGIVIASSNTSLISMAKFKGFIETACKESNRRYRILEEFSLPDDFKTTKAFPEGNYLKVVFFQVQ